MTWGAIRKILVFVSMLSLSIAQSSASNRLPGNIQLLPGYTAKGHESIDSSAWTIEKPGGLTIEFKMGVGAGFLANPKFMKQYSWYAEQIVNGHRINMALTKPGQITIYSPPRMESGTILLVSFPIGPTYQTAANFSAKVSNQRDVAEMLLMVLTYNPRIAAD
jgi:hypothetical protein